MAVSLILTPDALALTKGGRMLYQFQGSGRYQTTGTTATTVLRFYGPVPAGTTLNLRWNGKTVPVVAKASPTAANEFPSGDGGAEYARQLSLFFQQYFPFREDFKATGSDFGDHRGIVLEAKVAGTAYNVSQVGSQTSSGQTPVRVDNIVKGANPILRERYGVYVEVWLQKIGQAGFERAYADLIDADETGFAEFDAGDLIHDRLQADLPSFSGATGRLATLSHRAYYVAYGEAFGQPVQVGQVKSDVVRQAYLGGGDYEHRAGTGVNLLPLVQRIVVTDDRALRFGPQLRYVRPDQPEWLTFVNTREQTQQAGLKLLLLFDNNTSRTVTDAVPAFSFAFGDKWTVPVGPYQLNLAQYVPAGASLQEYQVRLTVAGSDPDGNNHLSTVYRYVLAYQYEPYVRHFAYQNSLGAIDTLTTFGKGTAELQRFYKQAERSLPASYELHAGQFVDYDITLQQQVEVTTGFRDQTELRRWRDFYRSPVQLRVEAPGKVLAIGLVSKSIKEAKDGDTLFAHKFEYVYLHRDEFYSEGDEPTGDPLPPLGLVVAGNPRITPETITVVQATDPTIATGVRDLTDADVRSFRQVTGAGLHTQAGYLDQQAANQLYLRKDEKLSYNELTDKPTTPGEFGLDVPTRTEVREQVQAVTDKVNAVTAEVATTKTNVASIGARVGTVEEKVETKAEDLTALTRQVGTLTTTVGQVSAQTVTNTQQVEAAAAQAEAAAVQVTAVAGQVQALAGQIEAVAEQVGQGSGSNAMDTLDQVSVRAAIAGVYETERLAVVTGTLNANGSVTNAKVRVLDWARAAQYIVDRLDANWQTELMTRLATNETAALSFVNNASDAVFRRICERLGAVGCGGSTQPPVLTPKAPTSVITHYEDVVVNPCETTNKINVAYGVRASVNTQEPGEGWDVSHFTNGDQNSPWSSLSLTNGLPAVITFDFAGYLNGLTSLKAQPRLGVRETFPRNLIIDASADGTTWQTVLIHDSEPTPTSDDFVCFPLAPIAAFKPRFIRLTSTQFGSDGFSLRLQYNEIQVWASSIEPLPQLPVLIQGSVDVNKCDDPEVTNAYLVAGWAADLNHPEVPQTVVLYKDGIEYARQTCQGLRQDVVDNVLRQRGYTGNANVFGFRFVKGSDARDGQTHTWEVRVLGSNVEFTYNPNGQKVIACAAPVNNVPYVKDYAVNGLDNLGEAGSAETYQLLEVLSDNTLRNYSAGAIPQVDNVAGLVKTNGANGNSVRLQLAANSISQNQYVTLSFTLPGGGVVRKPIQLINADAVRPAGLTTFRASYHFVRNGVARLYNTLDDANTTVCKHFSGIEVGDLDLFSFQAANLNVGTVCYLGDQTRTDTATLGNNIYPIFDSNGGNTVLKSVQVSDGKIIAVKDNPMSCSAPAPAPTYAWQGDDSMNEGTSKVYKVIRTNPSGTQDDITAAVTKYLYVGNTEPTDQVIDGNGLVTIAQNSVRGDGHTVTIRAVLNGQVLCDKSITIVDTSTTPQTKTAIDALIVANPNGTYHPEFRVRVATGESYTYRIRATGSITTGSNGRFYPFDTNSAPDEQGYQYYDLLTDHAVLGDSFSIDLSANATTVAATASITMNGQTGRYNLYTAP